MRLLACNAGTPSAGSTPTQLIQLGTQWEEDPAVLYGVQNDPAIFSRRLLGVRKIIDAALPFLGTGILTKMNILVTPGAEGDQISLDIVSQPAPRLDVVHLEPARVPALLAAPPIPL